MKPTLSWPLMGLLLAGAAPLLASTPDRVEGLPNWEPRALLQAEAPAVQPARIEPPEVCAGGGEITLFPPPGQVFGPQDAGSRVLFAPCGISGDVVEWTPDFIRVKVPVEAETGPVWLAAGVGSDFSAELQRGAACRRSLAEHEVVPERLITECDKSVGDAFDPRAASLLRGIPDSPATPGGQRAKRAAEAPAGAPPACRLIGPDRRAPLTFKAAKGTNLRQGQGMGGGHCFESCEELSFGQQNQLIVNTPPRIERFLPAASEIRAPRVHRVVRGANAVQWDVDSGRLPAALTLARSDGGSDTVGEEGEIALDVLEPIDLTLTGSNACGVREVTLHLEPAATLQLLPERLDVAPGGGGELRVRLSAALAADVELVLDNSSGGAFTVVPPRITVPAGATEVRVRVEMSATAGALGGSRQAGQVTARAADPMSGVLDAREPTRVHVLVPSTPGPPPAPVPPGPTEMLVRGRLTYSECFAPGAAILDPAPSGGPITLDGAGCGLDGAVPIVKPVRRARVELWDQAPFIDVQRAVVETDDEGRFRAIVPAGGTYDVTVVASSMAGQVNLRDDAITWFWKPLGLAITGAGGTELPEFTFNFPRADAAHFNALDAITRGLEYAGDRLGVPFELSDPIFRKTVVIPGSLTRGGITLRVGNATHIWVDAGVDIFEDAVVLHEYGHHLQHANGSYHAWGVFHNGAYMSVVPGPACWDRRMGPGAIDTTPDRGCWINSPELAWFEGFPKYFANTVLDSDAGRSLTRTFAQAIRFTPAPAQASPLLSTPHFDNLNRSITGAATEDHVAGALRALRSRTDVPGPGGAPATPSQIEAAVFQTFFQQLSGAPTVFSFRDAWRARFGPTASWTDLMTFFGM